MAEALGITASIITVLDLAKKTVKYLNDVKSAPSERHQLVLEISTIIGCFYMLKDSAERAQAEDSYSTAWGSVDAPNGPIKQLQLALETLVTKLRPRHGVHGMATALKWTFDKVEINQILSRIERQKSLLVLALQNDQASAVPPLPRLR